MNNKFEIPPDLGANYENFYDHESFFCVDIKKKFLR